MIYAVRDTSHARAPPSAASSSTKPSDNPHTNLPIRVKLPGGVRLMPHRHPEDPASSRSSPASFTLAGRTIRRRKTRGYLSGAVINLPGGTPTSSGPGPASTSRR